MSSANGIYSLDPSVLPDAQTFVRVSNYVGVVQFDEASNSNTEILVSEVLNITFSPHQRNVTVNVGSNKIWFSGVYTTSNSANIVYVNPPYGNDVEDSPTVVYDPADVPPQKFIYLAYEPDPEGVTVNHALTVRLTNGVVLSFTINRFVYPNIYTMYNFLSNYDYYGDE